MTAVSAHHRKPSDEVGTTKRAPRARRRGGPLRWVVVAAAGLCVAVSGCTATATGRPVAAPGLGRWQPPPILAPHLSELLLSGEQIDAAAGTTGMTVLIPFSKLQHGQALIADRGCLDAYMPAEAPVYQGSNWNSVEGQILDDLAAPGAGLKHSLFETVVGFRDADSARRFFGRAKTDWSSCGNRDVTINRPGKPPEAWSFGEPVATDTTLSLRQTRVGDSGFVCQRAMGLANNVIIDTVWCGSDTTDQAGKVVATLSAAITQA
jgi:hypothetical protein